MPTSEQIEQKQLLIAKQEAAEKAQKDSIKRVADSIQVANQQNNNIITTQNVKLRDIKNKYLVVVGTFLMQKNVDRCIEKYGKVMDKPFTIKRWDDMIMVVVAQAATEAEANAKLEQVKSQCPEAWIYINRTVK